MRVSDRVVNEDPDLPELPAVLAPLIEASLSKDPRERPKPEAVADALAPQRTNPADSPGSNLKGPDPLAVLDFFSREMKKGPGLDLSLTPLLRPPPRRLPPAILHQMRSVFQKRLTRPRFWKQGPDGPLT